MINFEKNKKGWRIKLDSTLYGYIYFETLKGIKEAFPYLEKYIIENAEYVKIPYLSYYNE